MYASALPRESRSSEICVKIKENLKKTSPTLSIVPLKNQQILIIFGRNTSDTTGY